MAESDEAAAKEKRKHRVISYEYAVAVNEWRAFFESEAKEKSRIKVTRPLERATVCFDISQESIIETRRKLETGEVFYDQEQRDRAMDVPPAFLPIMDMEQSDSSSPSHEGMGYTHGEKRSYYQNLKENVSVTAQRIKYIHQANKNTTPTNARLDLDGNGGLKVPQGKGERCIISHIGWSGGFVNGAKLIFRGKKSLKDADYHTEMNYFVFLDWLEKRVLPAIPSGSVLVLDRVTYHTTLTEETKPAKSTFNKLQFCEWLQSKGVAEIGAATVDKLMRLTRVDLADMSRRNKPDPVHQATVLAQKFGCDVIFLPVGHPELNPIEMVWAQVKRCIAGNNKTFSLREAEALASTTLESVDGEQWGRCVEHCICVEDKYMEAADYAQIEL